MKNVFRMSGLGVVVGLRAVEGDSELAAINRYTLKPLTADEVAVFEIEVCHDEVDGHFSRFPKEELAAVARLTPGRPLMVLHDTRTKMPLGKIFRSWLSPAENRTTVRADVYVLRTEDNRGAIENIEGGVWAETSIGFAFKLPECSICGGDLRMCDHIPGREYEGQVCHYAIRNVVEVIEVSLVPSGSQGTEVVGARGFSAELEAARAARVGDEGVDGVDGVDGAEGAAAGEGTAGIAASTSASLRSPRNDRGLELRRRRLELEGKRWTWAALRADEKAVEAAEG